MLTKNHLPVFMWGNKDSGGLIANNVLKNSWVMYAEIRVSTHLWFASITGHDHVLPSQKLRHHIQSNGTIIAQDFRKAVSKLG
jgi:hypothetical protein